MKKRLLSFVLAVLMIASLLPATALAAYVVTSGTCGAEVTWTLDSEGVLTISGSGDMYDYGSSGFGAPWHGIRSRVKSAVIAEGVTSIGLSAFEGCSSLTSVTIPNSVTSIGEYAFSYCTSLTSVTIPDSVTSISGFAFEDCTSLTSVTIPDSVTSIGVGAFASCTSLTGIWVAEGNSHYSSDASGVLFNKDKTTLVQCPGAFAAYTIPDSVTSISGFAFEDCTSLTSVTIPDSVTSICDYTFASCASLTSVTIPDSVTSIGEQAFMGCSSLTSVTIPDSVTSIGKVAFTGCSSLTSVTIPDSVTSIDWYAFSGCTSLTSVTIPDSVTSISGFAFEDCTSLTSVTIPDSVTSIGVGAFASCTSLTGIWVAEGNSHYSSDASGVLFNKDKTTLVQCPGAFAAYTIPDSVTSISGFAFEDCTSLTRVTIPDSVTIIGGNAFSHCDNLTDVYYTGTEIAWNKIKISDYNDALKNATIHYFSEWTREKEPTCTEPGSETSVCPEAGCGKTFTREIPALGHSWDNGKVTKEPTETETGVKTFSCTRCGETRTETMPVIPHVHSYKDVVTAPTCTAKGYTTHICACGDSYVDTYVDALGHAWDNGKVTKEPTETETGVKTFACTRCGETRTEVIPATGSDVDVTEMFSDVTKNWAYPGIQYCVTHKLMSGTGGDKFAPTMTTTRAQIVQILYNLEGEPKVSGTTPFTDLTQDWYQDAVLWAYQTGVVAGTGDGTTFDPGLPVTREQIAVILMEYTDRILNIKRTWTPADLSGFPDAASVSGWAKDAMADAVALGLISGASNGGQTYLNPQGSATREQVATILMEFCKNVKK